MSQVAPNQVLQRVPRSRRRRFDKIGNHLHAGEPPVAGRPPEQIRLPLAQRYALRDAIAYAVESPEGEIGFVAAVRIAPFAYWPDELIVEADPGGPRLRVPIDTVTAVLPREGRLFVTRAPVGAQPVARPR